MKAAKLITALALLALHGAAGDDLSPPPPPPPSDDATAAPTAAPTVSGYIPYDGNYTLHTDQSHSCYGNATCPSAFALGSGIASVVTPSSTFLPDGLVRLEMKIKTTSSKDDVTSRVTVSVDCVPFELVDASCQAGCDQVSTFEATLDPRLLSTQCPS